MIEEELHPLPPPWRVCGYCSKKFQPKDDDQKFCKRKHAEYARRRKQKLLGYVSPKPNREKRPELQFVSGVCPTPEKRFHFHRERNAWRFLRMNALGKEKPLIPYHCGCNKWHFKTVTWDQRSTALAKYLEKEGLTWENL